MRCSSSLSGIANPLHPLGTYRPTGIIAHASLADNAWSEPLQRQCMGPSRSSLARFGARFRAPFGPGVVLVGPPLLAAPAGELEPVAPDEAGGSDGGGPESP